MTRSTTSARPPARVELAIGELELIGFSAAHRHVIAGALERGLGELIAARGWPTPGASEPERELGAKITLDAQAGPERVGRAIAEAIYHAAGSASARTRP